MAVHFHLLTVREVRKETSDCVSISFEVPDELKKEFAFEQGQNLTFRKKEAGEEIRRNYSICSAPYENELRVAIKKVEGGLFSNYANTELKAGDQLDVLSPTGKFNTPIDPLNKKNYLAIAAGSGITPVISIIKTLLKNEPKSNVTLIYGNRTRGSIIFFEELEGLKNKYLERFSQIHILSREKTESPVHFGRINDEKLEALQKLVNYPDLDEVFLCGPEQMIFTTKDFLEKKGIDRKKIHFELFNTGTKKIVKTETQSASYSGRQSRITIKTDGRSIEFSIPFDQDTTILEAALIQGADLPYACKGGMCCTCKARLLEGEVTMDVHWGLEEEEVEKGFILTCQSHPKTEKILVDFDFR